MSSAELSERVKLLDKLYLKADAKLTAWLECEGTVEQLHWLRKSYLRARGKYEELSGRSVSGFSNSAQAQKEHPCDKDE